MCRTTSNNREADSSSAVRFSVVAGFATVSVFPLLGPCKTHQFTAFADSAHAREHRAEKHTVSTRTIQARENVNSPPMFEPPTRITDARGAPSQNDAARRARSMPRVRLACRLRLSADTTARARGTAPSGAVPCPRRRAPCFSESAGRFPRAEMKRTSDEIGRCSRRAGRSHGAYEILLAAWRAWTGDVRCSTRRGPVSR